MIAPASTMVRALQAFVLASAPADATPPQLPSRLKTDAIVLQAAEVHAGDGTVFKPGIVVVLDGKIVAAGPAPPLPAGSRTIDCGNASITPGLIDAACQLGTFSDIGYTEQASEVIPQLDAADAIDFYSKDWEQLAREGVTTVFVTGEAASVISCKGASVKTGGPIAERKLAGKPCVKATIGPESSRRGAFNFGPSRFSPPTIFARRPTTRMGSTFVFRQAFLDALAFRDGKPVADPAAAKALLDVVNGTTSLRMQAREAMDLRSAARLCDEFGLQFTLEYAIEAGECLDLITARKIPVIFGPVRPQDSIVTQGFEDGVPAYGLPKQLADLDVRFCLTACDGIGEGGLARQAGLAVRFGLDRARAVRAVTADAAAMLGLEKRLGRLGAGLDADLVVWNGPPFDDASKPILVLINGRPVFDPEGRFAKENS